MSEKKNLTKEQLFTSIAAVLTPVGLILFLLSYSTGYYVFGQMNSLVALCFAVGALIALVAGLILRRKHPDNVWISLITYLVTGCLAAAAFFLIGDRVEAIGTCIITDYDSGHGGEEAIYLSFGAFGLWILAMIFNIIGSFKGDEKATTGASKAIPAALACVLALCVLVPSLKLGGMFGGSTAVDGTSAGTGTAAFEGAEEMAGTYTVSYATNNENLDNCPSYQFLCSDFSGFLVYDSRFYVDETLTLNADGTYSLFSDAYVIENGERAVVGDDTGLGMVLTTTAEGTWTLNESGQVVTSAATHAVFEMEMDTYSSQMKEAADMNVDGNTDDGVYDSDKCPAVLDFVSETVWTLDESNLAIITYMNPNAEVQTAEDETSGESDEEPAEISGETPAETGNEGTSAAEITTVDSADAATHITFYEDGTYLFTFPDYSVEDAGTYTFTDAALTLVNANGTELVAEPSEDGSTLNLHYVSSLSDALTGEFAIEAASLAQGATDTADDTGAEDAGESTEGTEAASKSGSFTTASDDGATYLKLSADGTYLFTFPDYQVEDAGTYTYMDGVLTIVNANGTELASEASEDGATLALHYVSSLSDALTGDFTLDAANVELVSGSLTTASDDGATYLKLSNDGTYLFTFPDYQVEDAGTYTYTDGVLTLVNANGTELVAEVSEDDATWTLHYVSSLSDALTGDFTLDAAKAEMIVG